MGHAQPVLPARRARKRRLAHLRLGCSRVGTVQAVCDFVNGHLAFLHGSSNPWTTAADAYRAGQGVCRDFAHLAITFCRALNIPSRYAFGYIPNIGIPPPYEPTDFCAWFEVYLSGRWYTFDARINQPRVGACSSDEVATRSTWP